MCRILTQTCVWSKVWRQSPDHQRVKKSESACELCGQYCIQQTGCDPWYILLFSRPMQIHTVCAFVILKTGWWSFMILTSLICDIFAVKSIHTFSFCDVKSETRWLQLCCWFPLWFSIIFARIEDLSSTNLCQFAMESAVCVVRWFTYYWKVMFPSKLLNYQRVINLLAISWNIPVYPHDIPIPGP